MRTSMQPSNSDIGREGGARLPCLLQKSVADGNTGVVFQPQADLDGERISCVRLQHLQHIEENA